MLSLGLFGFGTIATEASVLLTEQFDYSAGSLYTGSGGAWTESAAGTDPTVTGGSLTYTGLADSSGNAVQFAAAGSQGWTALSSGVSAGSVYFSFLMQVSSSVGAVAFASLESGSGLPAITVCIQNNGSGFNFGVKSGGTASTTSATFESRDNVRDFNTTYLVAGRFDFGGAGGTDTYLYIDPTPGSADPGTGGAIVTDAPQTAFNGTISRFYLLDTTPSVVFDELRVGTTWADVTPVPEPTNIALAVFGLGAVAFGAIRRFRPQLRSNLPE